MAFDKVTYLMGASFNNHEAHFPTLVMMDTLKNTVGGQYIGFTTRFPDYLYPIKRFRLSSLTVRAIEDPPPTPIHQYWRYSTNTVNIFNRPNDLYLILEKNSVPIQFDSTLILPEKMYALNFYQNSNNPNLDFLPPFKPENITIVENPDLNSCAVLCEIIKNFSTSQLQDGYTVKIKDNATPCNLPDLRTWYCDSLANPVVDIGFDKDKTELLLFPNPTSNTEVNLQAPSGGLGVITVFNWQLKRMPVAVGATNQQGRYRLDISQLPKGAYFVSYAHTDGQVHVAQLVVE